MKKIFGTALLITLAMGAVQSCETQKVVVNREVDSKNDGKMLLDAQKKSQFLKDPYKEWYSKEHDDYSMDAESLAELKKQKINSYSILVFLGTWCDDSHREFPRLMKILEAENYPEQKLRIIAVNRKKESPSGEESAYNIQKVPTIIVSRYGKELGRIVEAPKSGWLEKDLLEIIKKDKKSFKNLFKNQ